MCLHSPRRALIDGLSAWMCQTGKINYRSPKQYLYWLSRLEFAFVGKISFPLSITNKQTCCIFLIFFSLKAETFKSWNILTIKEGPKSVLTLIKCLPPLSHWISFICIFGSHFFCHFYDFLLNTETQPCQTFQEIMELKSTHRQQLAFIQGWGGGHKDMEDRRKLQFSKYIKNKKNLKFLFKIWYCVFLEHLIILDYLALRALIPTVLLAVVMV